MMYPFMALNDDTEITHSEMKDFWSNENSPLEPVHVHIAEGRASANATKLWITSTGKAMMDLSFG